MNNDFTVNGWHCCCMLLYAAAAVSVASGVVVDGDCDCIVAIVEASAILRLFNKYDNQNDAKVIFTQKVKKVHNVKK